jgi:hypothetical protein
LDECYVLTDLGAIQRPAHLQSSVTLSTILQITLESYCVALRREKIDGIYAMVKDTAGYRDSGDYNPIQPLHKK